MASGKGSPPCEREPASNWLGTGTLLALCGLSWEVNCCQPVTGDFALSLTPPWACHLGPSSQSPGGLPAPSLWEPVIKHFLLQGTERLISPHHSHLDKHLQLSALLHSTSLEVLTAYSLLPPKLDAPRRPGLLFPVDHWSSTGARTRSWYSKVFTIKGE